MSLTPADPRGEHLFRRVLGRFATGIAVVTSVSGGEPVGLTCQAFASVSLDPPLVLFCAAKTSHAWPRIQESGGFCANLLGAEQEKVSEVMATRGVDKFADLSWTPSPVTGSPLIDGVLGYVDCTVDAVHDAGDHDVVIGRVQALGADDGQTEPLLRFEGDYRSLR